MLPTQSILAQAPGHNTAEIQLIHNIRELAGNHIRRIPRPEDIHLVIEIILSALIFVEGSVRESLTPRIDNRDALTGAVIGETAGLAEIICGTTIFVTPLVRTRGLEVRVVDRSRVREKDKIGG